jgi:hypothetical protein
VRAHAHASCQLVSSIIRSVRCKPFPTPAARRAASGKQQGPGHPALCGGQCTHGPQVTIAHSHNDQLVVACAAAAPCMWFGMFTRGPCARVLKSLMYEDPLPPLSLPSIQTKATGGSPDIPATVAAAALARQGRAPTATPAGSKLACAHARASSCACRNAQRQRRHQPPGLAARQPAAVAPRFRILSSPDATRQRRRGRRRRQRH